MDHKMLIECIGYLGSLLVLASMLMTSVFKLRVINTIGSLIFTVYALIIHSYPTALMNACLVLINLRFLWKMKKMEKDFALAECSPGDSFVRFFVDEHRNDIRACFPGISLNFTDATQVYLVCCEGKPVGVTAGQQQGDVMNLLVDYTIPQYRDFSVGRYLMAQLKEKGIAKLCYGGPVEHHLPYLQKLGFEKNGELYEKTL